MVYMNTQQCKVIVAGCCKIVRGELSRWADKPLSDDDLKEHYDPKNWTCVGQNTTNHITVRNYRFNKDGLRVEGSVVCSYSGYCVALNLWGPKVKLGEETSVWGPFEKPEKRFK